MERKNTVQRRGAMCHRWTRTPWKRCPRRITHVSPPSQKLLETSSSTCLQPSQSELSDVASCLIISSVSPATTNWSLAKNNPPSFRHGPSVGGHKGRQFPRRGDEWVAHSEPEGEKCNFSTVHQSVDVCPWPLELSLAINKTDDENCNPSNPKEQS